MSQELLQVIDTAASFVGVVITAIIAWQVYQYTRRKDKMTVIHDMWKQQQEWNLVAAGSPAHQKAVEQMVYGIIPNNEEERLALNSCMFYFLNRINHMYDAYTSKIISYDEFLIEAKITAPLCVGHKDLAFLLLTERGYDQTFADEMKKIINGMSVVGPVDPFKDRMIAQNQ